MATNNWHGTMQWRQDVAVRLAEARLAKRLTQKEVAVLSGHHLTAITHFERVNRVPSAWSLKRLAEALEVSIDYVLGVGES